MKRKTKKQSLSGFDLQFSTWDPKYKLIALGSVLTLGVGSYLLIRSTLTQKKADEAIGQSLVPKSPANWATRFNEAFYNGMAWKAYGGTDEAAIWDVISEMKTQKDMADTGKIYSVMFPGQNLATDLKNELDSKEYKKMSDLIYRKPKK